MFWVRLGTSGDVLEASWGCLGAILGRLGVILGGFWRVLEASWDHFGDFLKDFLAS